MDITFQSDFINKWRQYFGQSRLPICWFYTNTPEKDDLENSANTNRCLIGNLNNVYDGKPLVYQKSTSGCPGGKRYAGFVQKLRPDFRYFLSCGIEGEMEGEGYKKTPELVDEQMKLFPAFEAPAEFLVFKRWDKLLAVENPEVVVFLDSPDVISVLFTLANFDLTEHGVIAPFGSGCSSVIDHPRRESFKENPKCILGMFDISARPFVHSDFLSFAIPYKRFNEMVVNMDESFLTTKSWKTLQNRLL
jgi:hypothetical protein